MKNYKNHSYFDGKKFRNDDYQSNVIPQVNRKVSILDFFKWRLFQRKSVEKWPEWIENKIYSKPYIAEKDELIASFVNHSTVLLQIGGLNILTDPVWSERVSPFSFLGPKRVRDAGIKIDDLPHIDLIVLSHDHYDHLDINSLKIIDEKFKPIIIAGCNINSVLRKHQLNCIELNWWQNFKFKDLEIVFLPAKHWSGRKGFFDNNSTLWGSFLIRYLERTIYFAGDTAYSDHIKIINNEFGAIDLALIPIGAYLPRWLMKESHVNPHEAVLIHQELQSKHSIAIHYGTFRLSDEGYYDPINDLNKALENIQSNNTFRVLDFGESWKIY